MQKAPNTVFLVSLPENVYIQDHAMSIGMQRDTRVHADILGLQLEVDI